MTIQVINPIEDLRWDNFIAEHPLSSIYHHSSWKLLIESTFKKLHPYYITSFDKQGNIKGVLPSFISNTVFSGTHIISLPLATYCDPLFYSEKDLHQSLNALIKKWKTEDIKFIELRSIKDHRIIKELKFEELKYYLNHLLKIDKNLVELKTAFHKNAIQQPINQSLNFDLSLTLGKDINDIKIFYGLETLTRRKIGLPPLPFTFFRNMWEIFFPKGLMSLLLVKYKSRYISSAILLKYKNCIYYEYSASDPGFLKLHPNHFILWEAIKLAHQEEYSYFYFGRSSIDNRGLIDFKRRWGTEEKALYYYYFPYAQSISAESRESLRFRLTKSICKKMPIKLLQTFGDITYKYLL